MALVSHHPQGSYVTFSSRNLSWSKRTKLKQCLTKHHFVGRTDWHFRVKRNVCLSVASPYICRSKFKPLRISAFKGKSQNDESGSRTNGLKISKSSVIRLESGEALPETPKVHNVPLSYASEANESLATSPAIYKLFKKWLTMLRTQPSNDVAEEFLGELAPGVVPKTPQGEENKEKLGILKVFWSHFLSLDATMKIPLLLFIPFYLAVNIVYGADVSKELTPLWVLGPIIMAFNIKIVRGLFAFYVKVLKNLPSYCILAYTYVARGKLQENIRAPFLQRVLDIKNLDYKELTGKTLKALKQWIVELYLDFMEFIWPYYCRTIRFLKRAHLI
ncbi:hypothetical protein L6164_014740 [Bauhinia variegata]|uniref:Uncharacterized protein n=1 Tax=Bauhinia variegata TaxID=167791 RepID=A0ACB9NK99_BAUVA|nr:hypothetical protein L6164_014740 [Bauhinia variegata]